MLLHASPHSRVQTPSRHQAQHHSQSQTQHDSPVRSTRRRPGLSDDAGQTTVLTLGLTSLVIALLLVMLAATSVAVQARKVQALADGAALAGAEELGFHLDQDPRVVLRGADVNASVEEYLVAVDARRSVPGLGGVSASVAGDQATVVVTVHADVSLLPPGGAFSGIVPLSVPVSAEGSSRTALAR